MMMVQRREQERRNVDKITLDSGLIATSFNTVYSDRRNKTEQQSIKPVTKKDSQDRKKN